MIKFIKFPYGKILLSLVVNANQHDKWLEIKMKTKIFFRIWDTSIAMRFWKGYLHQTDGVKHYLCDTLCFFTDNKLC